MFARFFGLTGNEDGDEGSASAPVLPSQDPLGFNSRSLAKSPRQLISPRSTLSPRPSSQAALATVGVDTTHDGRANMYVTGADRNHDGIPDFLQQGPMARVGLDTNHDGQANMFITGVDRNLDGIPDVLQQPAVDSRSLQDSRPPNRLVINRGLQQTALTPPMGPALTPPMAKVGLDINHDGRPNMFVTGVDRDHDGIPDVLQHTPLATVGVDTNFDGKTDKYVTGVDRNRDGIPDALQQGPMATVGVDTNHDGRANMMVTGVDLNRDGIPDVLQAPMAKVGVDTNHDGRPNHFVIGPDRNRDGIPDVLQGLATVGVDTTHDGRANMFVTGVDRNRDGIPDVLQQAGTIVRPAAGPIHYNLAPVVTHTIATPSDAITPAMSPNSSFTPGHPVQAVESVSWSSTPVAGAPRRPGFAVGPPALTPPVGSAAQEQAEDMALKAANLRSNAANFDNWVQSAISDAKGDKPESPVAEAKTEEEKLQELREKEREKEEHRKAEAQRMLEESERLHKLRHHHDDHSTSGATLLSTQSNVETETSEEQLKAREALLVSQLKGDTSSPSKEALKPFDDPNSSLTSDVTKLLMSSLLFHGMTETATCLQKEAGMHDITEDHIAQTQQLRKQRNTEKIEPGEQRQVCGLPFKPLPPPGMPANKANKYREAHNSLVVHKEEVNERTVQVKGQTDRLQRVMARIGQLRQEYPEPTKLEMEANAKLHERETRLRQLQETCAKMERNEIANRDALNTYQSERKALMEDIDTREKSSAAMEAQAAKLETELETLRKDRDSSETAQAQRIRKLLTFWDAPHGPKRIAAETFAHVDSNHDGRLEWKNDELLMFVRLIFQHHHVMMPPWPEAVWLEMYRLCDLDRSHSLDVVESLKFARCCFEAALRSLAG